MYVIPIDGFVAFGVVGVMIYLAYLYFKPVKATCDNATQKTSTKENKTFFWVTFAIVYFTLLYFFG